MKHCVAAAIVGMLSLGQVQAETPWYQNPDEVQARADKGDAYAQAVMGESLLMGTWGFTTNYELALSWLRKSEAQGHPMALCALGIACWKGHGLPKDVSLVSNYFGRAFTPLQSGASQGDPRWQMHLATCYREGWGVARDPRLAFDWYRKAAESGYAPAELAVAKSYSSGKGTRKDTEQAVTWCHLAAEQGFTPAQCMLGDIYREGMGVNKDRNQAFKWYQKAAEQQDPESEGMLGWCYEAGFGVEQNLATAFEWYRRGAQHGLSWAQSKLGDCYADGIGVDRNRALAVEWYRKAAAQGDRDAQQELGRFCRHRTYQMIDAFLVLCAAGAMVYVSFKPKRTRSPESPEDVIDPDAEPIDPATSSWNPIIGCNRFSPGEGLNPPVTQRHEEER